MLFCKFCGGKNEREYLYLSCRHLCCLGCAFLRAEFATQEIECCEKQTKIEQGSMEMIIKSKRFKKSGEEPILNQQIQEKQKSSPSSKIYQTKQHDQVIEHSESTERKENSDVKKVVTEYRREILEDDQYELESILIRHLDKSKQHFELQRQILKERQEETAKNLIMIFEKERRSITNPITQAELEKLNTTLEKKWSALLDYAQQNVKSIQANSGPHISQEKPCITPRQSYDHILKKLELNQQRMKQKIQKHLQVLY